MGDKHLFSINQNIRIKAYSDFAYLVNTLNKYKIEQTEESRRLLNLSITCCKSGMPLPSGRWGNQLAVALEMRLYDGAKYMIENAEELEIDINKVSSDFGGVNPWSAEEVYKFSILGFDFKEITADDKVCDEVPALRNLMKLENQNKVAAAEVGKMLVKK